MPLRIVGAGLGRTGTTSLKAAIEQLLDGRCYHMMEVFGRPDDADVWSRAADEDIPDWDQFLGGYVASVDWPGCAFWPELTTTYPDAMVLLSTRDANAWWESASKTIFAAMLREPEPGSAVDRQREMFLNIMHSRFTLNWDDADAAKAAYLRHNATVRETIPAERLIEWRPGDGWAPLCVALNVAVPDAEFPHVNTTDEFRLMAGLDEPAG